MSSTTTNAASIDPATLQPQQSEAVCFSHIHLYVDRLENVNVYKDLEDRLNQFAGKVASSAVTSSLAEKQAIWKSISGNADSSNENDNTVYQPQNRDVVKQLLAGFGFRVTGTCYPEEGSSNTRSVLVTSRDPRGVQILISAVDHDTSEATPHRYPYFDASKWCRRDLVYRTMREVRNLQPNLFMFRKNQQLLRRSCQASRDWCIGLPCSER
jgi:hypothetical protein